MLFANLLVWASLALSATALTTGNNARRHHQSVAKRHPEGAFAARSYQLRKRCAPRTPPTASSAAPASSSSVAAVADAGGDPDAQPSSTTAAPQWTPSSSAWVPQSSAASNDGSSSSGNNGNSGNNGGNSGGNSGGSSSPASSPASSSGNYYTGDGTYFYQNGNAGACGQYNQDSAIIAAMDTYWWNIDGNSICGKQVLITNLANGKQVTVTVADECPTCSTSFSIDLSVGAFTILDANLSDGELNIGWSWV